jgi:hypothetical protein
MNRFVILLVATLLATASVAADPPPPITEGTATRTADGTVDLEVTWQGGACEVPGEPTVMVGDVTTVEVTIPTAATSEICTMQIVPVTHEGTIAVEPLTTTLAIIVLSPDGQPSATGSIEIAEPATSN